MEKVTYKKRKRLTTFKKIRTEILVPVLVIIFMALALVTVINAVTSTSNTQTTLEKNMTTLAGIVADKIRIQLEDYSFGVESLAVSPDISSDKTDAEISAAMKNLAQVYGFSYVRRTNAQGIAYESGSDVSDRDYFIAAKNGETYVSDLLVTKDTGRHVFMVASPIMKGGRFDGVLYGAVDSTSLCDIIRDITIGETGGAYILSSEGITIGSTNQEQVDNEENVQELVKTDPQLKELAAFEADMCKGNTGFGGYSYGGKSKLIAYAPIQGTNGWSLGITTERAEYMQSTTNALIFSTLVALGILAVACILVSMLTNRLTRPLTALGAELQEFRKGNFSGDFPYEADETELGQVIGSVLTSKTYLQRVIGDISRGCREMANNNFDIAPGVEYIGEFKEIEDALAHIILSLSETLSQIDMAAQQVSSGSEQVSGSAQALAQGATEQASSIEELSARITDINTHVTQNAGHTDEVNRSALEVGNKIQTCNEDMQRLNSAMDDIRSSSEKISRIIKTIDDLAFQTNILALNAAVEAARAGEAGKGFAVVADEVRNLATKSAEAAKDTSMLIEGSVAAVKNGAEITVSTTQSLQEAAADMQDMVQKVNVIATATAAQAGEIAQVTLGIDQISGVVQTNSATSEESAAASEELSGQAGMLRNLVSRFKLKKGTFDFLSAETQPAAEDATAFASAADKYN